MDYAEFYEIAEYANKNWRGKFTPKEVACNAYAYLVEYQYSKKMEEVSSGLDSLITALLKDNSTEAKEWVMRITSSLSNS